MQGTSRFSVVTQVRDLTSSAGSSVPWKHDDALPVVSLSADNPTQARDRFLLDPANAAIAKGCTEGTHRVGVKAQSDAVFPG